MRASLFLAGLLLVRAPAAFAVPPTPIPADKLVEIVNQRFEDLRASVAGDQKSLDYITQAQASFKRQAEGLRGTKTYEVELRYLAEGFSTVVLPKAQATFRAMNLRAPGAAERELAKVNEDFARKLEAFETRFANDKRNLPEIQAAVAARIADLKASNPNAEALVPSQRDVITYFILHTPVINTTKVVIAEVMTGKPPPVTPPAPVDPKPAPPAGGGGSPQPVKPPPSWSDILDSIPKVGAPQALADQAGLSLQQGRYGDALAGARLALKFNPGNKDALAVLHVAKGRGEGAEAGAAGMAAAKGGAAALEPSRFPGAGPSGAASPSPEIAAAAASGAARLAGEQARGGALNALKLGDAAGALDILSKALAHDPENPALLNLRAQTYGRLGRWEEARKDAAAGLALAPGNMALLSIKALAENRTRRYREALETSEAMAAADPRSAWAFANRAHARAGLGDRDAMLADIGRAAALDPRFERAAAAAARLQLPSDADALFLFPGEEDPEAQNEGAPAAPARGRRFGVVMGAAVGGGALLALGLLSLVLAPLKDSVSSVFTKARRGPALGAVPTAEPASVAGNAGALIRGQYEISRQIGAGGMGMVYEGTDRSLGRRVAIKKMRDELRLNARDRERFVIEAKTVASLHHPNVVDIYAIAEEGDDVYLVFEYVDGKTVHDLVQAGRLGVPEAVSVARSMGAALAYAHSRGVIHRDMKPSNVMLTASGEIKVMDFGIARMAKDAATRFSMTNTVVGTPPYMAPEQEQGVVRKESDVYALAVCAYEMLTGKLPFIGVGAGMLMNKINMSYVPPSRAVAGLPEALDGVFLKAFQADPERRYRTPVEFTAALEAAADGARAPQA